MTGYPSKAQLYDLEENNHIGIRRLSVLCVLDSQPSDEAMLTLKALRPLDIDPDGMSGGSAFVLHFIDGKFKAYFAGIIVRGGREIFHILKSGYIYQFLNSSFAPAGP